MKLAKLETASHMKALLLGDSKVGKTSSLAVLPLNGYRLWIVDFDNGLQPLYARIKEEDPKALELVEYVTCRDRFSMLNGKPVPTAAVAMQEAMRTLDEWEDKLGEKDVLVVDSLTFMGEACLLHAKSLRNAISGPAHPADYKNAGELLANFLSIITDPAREFHVLILTHINYTDVVEGTSAPLRKDFAGLSKDKIEQADTTVEQKGYPACIGTRLPTRVGRWFNTVLMAEKLPRQQSRVASKRVILTRNHPRVDLACPVPVPDQLPLETGLLDIVQAFEAQKGEN